MANFAGPDYRMINLMFAPAVWVITVYLLFDVIFVVPEPVEIVCSMALFGIIWWGAINMDII